jgi:hypothetical protein
MAIEYFGGPRVLNGLSEATQTFSVGTAGTNFAISSSGGTHTFNIPDAGASARGLVTTGTQTFAGAKTFSGAISASNLSGTNTGDQTITLTGDVTGTGAGSFAATIASGTVTLAKMANMATASLIYRKTAGSGAPEVQTLATLKTDLGLTGTNSGDQTTIVGITGTKAQFDTAVTDGNFLYVGDAPTSHLHGNITNAGAIGSTSGLPIITTTSGVLTVGAFGTTAGTFAAGNDSRITGALTAATAASTYQPLAANLTALAGLASAADKLPYFTGSGTMLMNDFTWWGKLMMQEASRDTFFTDIGLECFTGTTIANVIEFKIGTTPQAIRIHGTWTSATTFEAVNLAGKTGANFEIGPMKGSIGGVLRGFTIGGYANESAAITPWLTFTNTGGATFATTLAATGVATFGTTVNCNANVVIGTNLAVTGATTMTGALIVDDQVYIRTGSIYFDSYGTHSGVRNRRANGTLASPTTVLSGDLLGFWNNLGYHSGGAFHTQPGAAIQMYAAEDYTATACGGSIRMLTTTIGTTTPVTRLFIGDTGLVGLGTIVPAAILDIATGNIRMRVARTPASAAASGNVGEVCWDTSYIYVCTATNTWKRVAIATW